MRFITLLLWDIRRQSKYGIHFLYLVFSLLYIGLLAAFPEAWRRNAAILMIFTDPAAMGIFFMGAIVLFEKSERTLDSLAVSPMRVEEYVFSKLLSISLIALLVALALGAFGGALTRPLVFAAGILLCSWFFSSLGLMIAVGCESLNGFMLSVIPVELVVNIPALAYLFGGRPLWLLAHPGAAVIELLILGDRVLPALGILLLWTALAAWLTCRVVNKAMLALGGAKL